MIPDELTDTVGEIYEAAVAPGRWKSALGASVAFVRGQRGILNLKNASTGVLDLAEIHELDPELITRWERDYGSDNPWAQSSDEPAEGQVGRGSDLRSFEALRASPTFREIMEPLGIYDSCWTALAANPIQKGFLTVFRDREQGLFSVDSVKRMTALSTHLVRSARIYSQLGELRLQKEVLDLALDKISFGLMTCTTDGRIVTLNRHAEALFRNGEPLRIRNGQIGCSDPDQSNRLRELIAVASATGSRDSNRGGGVLAFPQADGSGSTLTVTVIPLSPNTENPLASQGHGRATALLTFTRPNQSLRVPHGALNEIFGFTRSESEVALSLARGQSLADYASRSGVSIGTARWTFKNIQSKTGVGRQAELVVLINRSLAPLIDEDLED